MLFSMAAALLPLYLAVQQDLSTWPGGMREAIRRPPGRRARLTFRFLPSSWLQFLADFLQSWNVCQNLSSSPLHYPPRRPPHTAGPISSTPFFHFFCCFWWFFSLSVFSIRFFLIFCAFGLPRGSRIRAKITTFRSRKAFFCWFVLSLQFLIDFHEFSHFWHWIFFIFWCLLGASRRACWPRFSPLLQKATTQNLL